jgi:hypothetical protein
LCGDVNKRGIYRKATFWISKEEQERISMERDSDLIDVETEDHDEGLYPPVIGMLWSGLWRFPFNPMKVRIDCVCVFVEIYIMGLLVCLFFFPVLFIFLGHA